jgi:hypothetical protein
MLARRYQRGFVRPVFEELSRPPKPGVQAVAVIGTKPRKEWHEVGPRESVDRVKLDQTNPIDNLAKVATINTT